MPINIQNLLKELVSYTAVFSSNISAEAKTRLKFLANEFNRLEESSEPNKQAKMIELFIGGTIFALKREEQHYRYPFELYPNTLTNEVFKTVQEKARTTENMYSVGKQALLNLPNTFNGDLFKVEGKLINTEEPLPFFPDLKENAEKVDLLVKFCIKYAGNLNQPEVETADLNLVNLKVSNKVKITSHTPTDNLNSVDLKATDEVKITPHTPTDNLNSVDLKATDEVKNTNIPQPPSTLFSNTSMQVLGGFIAALGVAAVAVAFLALHAATFGIAGVIVAGIGVAAALGGLGLFAVGTYKKYQSLPEVVIEDSLTPVSI